MQPATRIQDQQHPVGACISSASTVPEVLHIQHGYYQHPGPVTIPAAPSGLSATAFSSSQINLSWTDNAGNETAYSVERAPGGTTSFVEIASLGANATSYQNTGLAASTSYAYRVRASNSAGSSAYSNTATTSTQAPPVTLPAAPSNLSATAASSSQINLSWVDNSNNETLFRVERAPGGTTSFVEINTVGANITTFQNTGLVSSTSYAYRVCAYNTAGNSSYSNVYTLSTPAMDYSFPGGTLADLKAVSPSLVFNNLTIAGKLSIPSTESNVTLTVSNLDVNAQVVTTWPTCSPYYDGPNLTVNSSGTVNVNSPINLSGMLAKDMSSTSTCNSCYGPDGGDLTINATAINMNNYVQTYGGQGARYYNSIGSYYDGCSGGPGGNITLNATNTLTVNATAADFDFYGGSGGYATGIGSNGAKGADGVLNFEGATITVAEISGDLNMYRYNAQNLDYEKMTVNGTLSKGEESAHRIGPDTYYIDYGGGVIDYLEDLYVVYLPVASTIKVSVTASNGLADLDMFVVNYAFNSILGQSNGAGSSESITTGILSAGRYIVAVSFADDCANNVSTNYSLKFNQ
ncbi:MAG: fibronectin type III domain-containing protein [Bacteroidales bacterium]